MKQMPFEFLDNAERDAPLRALEAAQKQRLIEWMAQAIAAVVRPAQGGDDEQP